MIKNIINNEDIEIMKKFIDKYEIIENENRRYILICESIRKNGLFQKYNDEDMENYSMEEIFRIIEINEINKINKENDLNRKKLLIDQLNELKKMIDYIKDYKREDENYKQLYKIDIEDNNEELPTKEYNKNEPIQTKEYTLNKSITITQIYKRIKELYVQSIRKENIVLDERFSINLKTYQAYKEEIIKYINKIEIQKIKQDSQNNDENNRKIERIK